MNKKSWYEFYKNNKGVNSSNIVLHWAYLIKIILSRPKNILEMGCGTADHSVFLSKILKKTNFYLLDNDKDIIMKLQKRYKKSIKKFYYCDITDTKDVLQQKFKRDFFDVIYSQGLFEHFDILNFKKIINNFMSYTHKFIISIPSEAYPDRDFGNEILRNKKELINIMKDVKNVNYNIISYFPDVGLRTKLKLIKKHKLNLYKSLFFIFFGSCHYLIEITRSF